MISKDLHSESAAKLSKITYLALLIQKTVVPRNCGLLLKAGSLIKLVSDQFNCKEKLTLTQYPY